MWVKTETKPTHWDTVQLELTSHNLCMLSMHFSYVQNAKVSGDLLSNKARYFSWACGGQDDQTQRSNRDRFLNLHFSYIALWVSSLTVLYLFHSAHSRMPGFFEVHQTNIIIQEELKWYAFSFSQLMIKDNCHILELSDQQSIKYSSSYTCFSGISYVPKERS